MFKWRKIKRYMKQSGYKGKITPERVIDRIDAGGLITNAFIDHVGKYKAQQLIGRYSLKEAAKKFKEKGYTNEEIAILLNLKGNVEDYLD